MTSVHITGIDEDNGDTIIKLRTNLDNSLQTLLKAHGYLEQAQRIVSAYNKLETFEPRDGAAPNATQFLASLNAVRRETLSRAQSYEKLCEDDVIQYSAAYKDRIRELHDALGAQSDIARRLPGEVVGQIFEWTFDEDDPLILLDICRVSSKWRVIALATPSLWNHLFIDARWVHTPNPASTRTVSKRPEFDAALVANDRPSSKSCHAPGRLRRRHIHHLKSVYAWVARSGAIPLHLQLRWRPSATTLTEWRTWLGEVSPRLESLVLLESQPNEYQEQRAFAELFFTSASVERSFPRLRVLDLMKTSLADVCKKPFRFDAPNLQSISFSQSSSSKDLMLEWSSVKTVRSFGTTEYGLLAFLGKAGALNSSSPLINNLHSLNLTLSDTKFPQSTQGKLEIRPTMLPSLRALTVTDDTYFTSMGHHPTTILNSIQTPDLQMLTWMKTKRCAGEATNINHFHAIFRTKNFPALTSFSLSSITFGKEDTSRFFRAIFRRMPTLTHLRLERMPVKSILEVLSEDDDEVQDAAGGQLDNRSQKHPRSLLPNLRHLILLDILDDPDYPLLPLLQYRGMRSQLSKYPAHADKRCVPLEEVEVDGRGVGKVSDT